ncbi:hypothetical protein D3C87_712670 [compost metagenome]
MENFSSEQIEQFLKIEDEIIGSADHFAITQKGIFDDILDGDGITQLTTKTH